MGNSLMGRDYNAGTCAQFQPQLLRSPIFVFYWLLCPSDPNGIFSGLLGIRLSGFGDEGSQLSRLGARRGCRGRNAGGCGRFLSLPVDFRLRYPTDTHT